MNVYQKTENQNLCINAAKTIGCQVVNVGAADLIEGRPILILGVVWQIIKLQLTHSISLKDCPELVLLLEDGEELEDLLKLSAEDILLRWFNYHLKASGSARRVCNFGSDLKDSECYSILINQVRDRVRERERAREREKKSRRKRESKRKRERKQERERALLNIKLHCQLHTLVFLRSASAHAWSI